MTIDGLHWRALPDTCERALVKSGSLEKCCQNKQLNGSACLSPWIVEQAGEGVDHRLSCEVG